MVYAEGLNGSLRQSGALELVERIPLEDQILPAQALAELFDVLAGKGGLTRSVALEHVDRWQASRTVIATSLDILRSAFSLSVEQQFRIWGAVILVPAESAGCPNLLSEDMHDGFAWGGITVVNPFADEPHRLLRAVRGDDI